MSATTLDELAMFCGRAEVEFEEALRKHDESNEDAQRAWERMVAAREKLDKAVDEHRAASRLRMRGDNFYAPALKRISQAFPEAEKPEA